MKKTRSGTDMLAEYDFSRGVRGKYARRYASGANVVVLDPDVAAYFPDPRTVNESLRLLIAISRRGPGAAPRAASRRRVNTKTTYARSGRKAVAV